MLNKKSVDDINVKGQRVLVRCDFNVPLIDGKITVLHKPDGKNNQILWKIIREIIIKNKDNHSAGPAYLLRRPCIRVAAAGIRSIAERF